MGPALPQALLGDEQASAEDGEGEGLAGGMATSVLAVLIAVAAWYAGPFRVPRKLRGFFGAGVAALRESAERHGISTGRTGEWIYSQRILLRAVVAVIASVIVVFVRPLTPSLMVWTLVLAALVIGVLELVQRPRESTPDKTDTETPVLTVP